MGLFSRTTESVFLVCLLIFGSSSLNSSVRQTIFTLRANPTRGPVRLGPAWMSNTAISCACRCMELYHDCSGFLFNHVTNHCTPVSVIDTRQPLPSESEGLLYHNFNCESRGFKTFIRGDIKVCLREFIAANFSVADITCRSLGAFLISVKTADKFSILAQEGVGDEEWIGCENQYRNGTFFWKEDDSVLAPDVIEDMFLGGLPKKNCVSYQRSYMYMDSDDCSVSKNYFCELPLP